jgi:PAS domain S-box-containing protein
VFVLLKPSRIVRQVLIYIVLCGGIFAVCVTALFSYRTYGKEVQVMHAVLDTVGLIASSGIAAGVYDADPEKVETMLRRVAGMYTISAIEVHGKSRDQIFNFKIGDLGNTELIRKTFPLNFSGPSSRADISGTLVVAADLGQLKQQVWKKGLENFLVIYFLVGIFSAGMAVLIQNLVRRQETEVSRQKEGALINSIPDLVFSKDRNGQTLGLIGISRDITGRKAMESEMAAAKERFENAFNASPIMIMVVESSSRRCIDVNLPCLEKTGYLKQEFLTGTMLDLGLWCDDSNYQHILEAVDGSVEEFPVRIRKKSGKEINCLLSCRKATFSNTECLLIFLEDLSKREMVERALQASECRFRDFASTAADLFWETDTGLRFTYITGKVREVLGMEIEDIVGSTWEQIFIDHGKVEDLDWRTMYDKFSRREPFSGFEVDWLRPDGKQRRIVLGGKQISGSDGGFAGYRGTGRDITLRKEAEETMRRSMKMDAVGQVTGGIAHDFNNILGIIIGNLDFIKRFGITDELILRRVEAATKASERASKLTRQLLDFSRRQAHNCQPTNINTIIQGMDSLITRSVTPEVEVVTDLSPDLSMTDIDSGDFEDVLLNLVINARDAMPDGGRLHITTSNIVLDEYYTIMNPGLKSGKYVLLAVNDTGVGIASEVLEHIFEPFYTTKPHGKGTGLGMSMVYAFAQRSKGSVRVYSEPGTGTTVHIYLPRTTEKIQQPEGHPQVMPGLPGGDETILIVDDEVDLLALAADMLKYLGYTTLTAKNGNEAIAMLLEKGRVIDLLFTDVVMPGGMNGFDLAEQALLLNPDQKILFASGYIEKAVPKIGRFAFSPRIIFKPYTELDLAIRISETLHA